MHSTSSSWMLGKTGRMETLREARSRLPCGHRVAGNAPLGYARDFKIYS